MRAPQDEAFETRARACEVCRTSSTCALLRMRTSIADFTVHHVKQPISFPRRVSAPGVASLLRSPRMRVGGAPRNVRVQRHPLGVHITRHARRLARRLASHDAGRSPLSALHRGGFGLRGRACLTGICAGSVTASSSHPGRSAWRAGSRASRDERLQAVAAGRHASLRIQDRLENTPSMSEAGNGSIIASNCSQVKNAFCGRKAKY